MSKVFTGASLTILLVAGLAHFAPSFDKLKLKHAPAPRLTADNIETAPPDYVPQIMREPITATPAADQQMFMTAARAAWAAVQHSARPATGLVASQPNWEFPTSWDIASGMAAYYSARELGFLNQQDYLATMKRTLDTVNKLKVYKAMGFARA